MDDNNRHDPTFQRARDSRYGDLPIELKVNIASRVSVSCRATQGHACNPSIPPLDGSCPFLGLPPETRREILKDLLPAKGSVIYPYATGNPKSRTCDLLVLNRQLRDELSEVLYEERTFAINVHEGVYHGGVEFLNSGVQRLQYANGFSTTTFKRFEGGFFSFKRIKRLQVNIMPSKDQKSKMNRHDPMLTYFMIVTMLDLLRKENHGKTSLTYLDICFKERTPHDGYSHDTAIAQYSNDTKCWWNFKTGLPSETSIYGVSNVELILRAFHRLDNVHNVNITIPWPLNKHLQVESFVRHTISHLKCRHPAKIVFDYDFEHKLDVARDAMDEFMFQELFGKCTIPHPEICINLNQMFADDGEEDGANSVTPPLELSSSGPGRLDEASIFDHVPSGSGNASPSSHADTPQAVAVDPSQPLQATVDDSADHVDINACSSG